ncbi:50S ribosomal protein L16 arginine hydroxylase [Vibrio sp. UCD-FRSSP16_10]|uniref:ribosomal protein uL16 3-hydroxylase n=1 Tax=unclassified Vibrio TaxID=2614977 RepID=UPI0007FE7472|nr:MULTISPECIES: cupin domain-containing protein [unclassified Vibrio]OBT13866.1 50S ribosomal protein L16 arginine hydroxylase [Vibrio sp. UCD-FRSSP16_30]OBT22747.1 50S ribosomal protein L16 arginine hydroxylase [Vibrio sp. UCD-FRSSP16_10]
MYQLTVSLEQFLAEFWQKKPTIIKGGFANFQDPISAEELAGLTMEEEVDSRYVSNINGEWTAEHGPFTEDKYANLDETNWSIIVQAANHWHLDAAQLIEPFKAMPQWLFDDLMISYSVKDGGVGPHIDQYDVFIIQGSGKRHWRVGEKDEGQYAETCRHNALRQIESFDSIIDDVLQPGDILYIPPGFPHDGYALEPSMSYSVGFRSPKEQELISNFADYVLANDIGDAHLHKPELSVQNNFGEIQSSDLHSLTQMLKSTLEDEHRINDFMGCLLSQSRHQLNIITPESQWQNEEVANHLATGGIIEKVAGLRALFHEQDPCIAYINGEVIKVASKDSFAIKLLCGQEHISAHCLADELSNTAVISLICDLVNKGYWFIDA